MKSNPQDLEIKSPEHLTSLESERFEAVLNRVLSLKPRDILEIQSVIDRSEGKDLKFRINDDKSIKRRKRSGPTIGQKRAVECAIVTIIEAGVAALANAKGCGGVGALRSESESEQASTPGADDYPQADRAITACHSPDVTAPGVVGDRAGQGESVLGVDCCLSVDEGENSVSRNNCVGTQILRPVPEAVRVTTPGAGSSAPEDHGSSMASHIRDASVFGAAAGKVDEGIPTPGAEGRLPLYDEENLVNPYTRMATPNLSVGTIVVEMSAPGTENCTPRDHGANSASHDRDATGPDSAQRTAANAEPAPGAEAVAVACGISAPRTAPGPNPDLLLGGRSAPNHSGRRAPHYSWIESWKCEIGYLCWVGAVAGVLFLWTIVLTN